MISGLYRHQGLLEALKILLVTPAGLNSYLRCLEIMIEVYDTTAILGMWDQNKLGTIAHTCIKSLPRPVRPHWPQ